MDIKVLYDEELAKEFHVHIPKEELDKHFDDVLKEQAPHISIAGFRKGKAPAALIKKNYGYDIAKKARSKAFNEGIQAIFEKYNLDVKKQVHYDVNKSEPDVLDFNVTYDVTENFDLKPFSELQLEEYVFNEKDEAFREEVFQKQFLNAKVDFENPVTETGIVDGQYVHSRISVFFDKELKMESYDAKQTAFLSGGTQSIKFLGKDFMKAVLGMKAGEKKTFDMTFPEDQPSKLAGKKYSVEVEIDSVYNVLSMTEDEFRLKMDIFKAENMEQFKDQLFAAFVARTKMDLLNIINKRKVLDALDAAYSFGFSKRRLNERLGTIKDKYEKEKAKAQENKVILEEEMNKKPEDLEKEFSKIAIRTLKVSEVFEKIREQFKSELQITQYRLIETLMSYALKQGMGFDVVQKVYESSEEFRKYIMNLVQEDVIIDFIRMRAALTKKELHSEAEMLRLFDDVIPGVLLGL